MEGQIELTEDQHLYLQRIFDYVREENRWPTFHELDQWFSNRYPHLDIEEIGNNLPPGLANRMNPYQLGNLATITVPTVYLLDKSSPVLTAFLEVIKLCVSIYLRSSAGNLEISSESILQKGPLSWDIAVRQAGLLLSVEPTVWLLFTNPDR